MLTILHLKAIVKSGQVGSTTVLYYSRLLVKTIEQNSIGY